MRDAGRERDGLARPDHLGLLALDLVAEPAVDARQGLGLLQVRVHRRALVRLDHAGNQPEEGGLARPVATNQAHALAGVYLKPDVSQQFLLAVGKRNVIEADEGHGAWGWASKRWRALY